MSHWKKFESKVLENVNKDILARAVAEMNLKLDPRIKTIQNTWGNESVDAGLVKNGKAIALGFNYKDVDGALKLELSGDFYATGLVESQFMDKLAQLYQKNNAIDKLEEQGWTMDTVEVNDKGEIVLEAYQWA